MNDFENRLREIPLHPPSDELDRSLRRMLGIVRQSTMRPRRGIPVGWSVAAALLMGIVGFAAGAAWRENDLESIENRIVSKEVQIIIKYSDVNPFDFSVQPIRQQKNWKLDIEQKDEI